MEHGFQPNGTRRAAALGEYKNEEMEENKNSESMMSCSPASAVPLALGLFSVTFLLSLSPLMMGDICTALR